VFARNIASIKEDPRHAEICLIRRAPPSLTHLGTTPPRWEELPRNHREELLRLFGQMLANRLDRDDEEVQHDRR